jgi:hypothetical protein
MVRGWIVVAHLKMTAVNHRLDTVPSRVTLKARISWNSKVIKMCLSFVYITLLNSQYTRLAYACMKFNLYTLKSGGMVWQEE